MNNLSLNNFIPFFDELVQSKVDDDTLSGFAKNNFVVPCLLKDDMESINYFLSHSLDNYDIETLRVVRDILSFKGVEVVERLPFDGVLTVENLLKAGEVPPLERRSDLFEKIAYSKEEATENLKRLKNLIESDKKDDAVDYVYFFYGEIVEQKKFEIVEYVLEEVQKSYFQNSDFNWILQSFATLSHISMKGEESAFKFIRKVALSGIAGPRFNEYR